MNDRQDLVDRLLRQDHIRIKNDDPIGFRRPPAEIPLGATLGSLIENYRPERKRGGGGVGLGARGAGSLGATGAEMRVGFFAINSHAKAL